ncbi:flagellar assembly protein FliX [Pelagibius sp.]|uniref:flagellar assembly protein FliX n=1 Tax=Pelagibius sp. TaxID=1931238 RepID=UPI003B511E6A
MKIDRLSGPRSAAKRKKAGASSTADGGFARALAGSAQEAGGTSGGGPVQAVSALLAIQEVSDASAGPSRGRRRAEDILDELEDLRLALMFGEVPIAQLEQLGALLAQREGSIEDPKLAEIVNEIEIRAAVELAKRGR